MKVKYLLYISLTSFLIFGCKVKKETPTIEEPVIEIPEVKPEPKKDAFVDLVNDYVSLKYPKHDFSKFIYISVKSQKLYLIQNDSIIKRYIISTATNGVGNKSNSNKTPPGLHEIKRKIGNNVPINGLFKARIFTGKKAKIFTEQVKSPTDDVTSRIMWLSGLEPGINKGRNIDSYKRYIYIHGTSEEGLLGQPASHGCIRMKNSDVIELFDLVEEQTPVLILKY